MTLIPQMHCCTMLGIGPKTLRHWLRHANMPFSIHPSDARLKCLMLEQVQQLATLHARPLQLSPPASPAFPDEVTPHASSQGQTAAAQANEAAPVSTSSSLSQEAELRKAVCGLEAKVLTLQEQLTQLTLELLRERSERSEQRLSALEALLSAHPGSSSSAQELMPVVEPRAHRPLAPQRPLQPAELRARSRVLARVEYGAQGLYVLVCPQDGALSFTPDSLEWFDWLASLTSFRFIGPQGRFSAYRQGQTRSWKAYRTFHGRSHKRSLGTTDRLTIARLEQVAASLQSELISL
ncbi:MAG: hypothetical protein ACJ8DI_05770 [Ktedonobacteraceae bacterium]